MGEIIRPIIYAACDTKYFLDHGLSLARSCALVKQHCLIEVCMTVGNISEVEQCVSEVEQCERIVNHLQNFRTEDFAYTKIVILYDTPPRDLTKEQIRTWYASLRFLRLPVVLEEYDRVLAIDVDGFLRKPIEISEEYDIGVFLRESNTIGADEYEINGMKVAAGALYVKSSAIEFAEEIANRIDRGMFRWFADQHAIYQTYQKQKLRWNVIDFAKIAGFMDWEFKEESLMWTAKGNRKQDTKYLQGVNEVLKGMK